MTSGREFELDDFADDEADSEEFEKTLNAERLRSARYVMANRKEIVTGLYNAANSDDEKEKYLGALEYIDEDIGDISPEDALSDLEHRLRYIDSVILGKVGMEGLDDVIVTEGTDTVQ